MEILGICLMKHMMIVFTRYLPDENSFSFFLKTFNLYSRDKTFGGQTEDCSVPRLRGGRQGFVSAHFQTKLRKNNYETVL